MDASSDLDLRYIFLPEDTVPKIPCVYAILNTWTSESYVGSTSNFYNRKAKHISYITRGKHVPLLQIAFEKAPLNFVFLVLERITDQEERLDREEWWIHNSNSSLNSNRSSRSPKGRTVSAETKKKMSISHSGKGHSEESKRKIGLPKKGIPRTLEVKDKLKAAAVKFYTNGGMAFNAQPVFQYDLNNNFIAEWPSAIRAEKALGVRQSGIWQCIYGRYKKSGGFIWKNKQGHESI